MMVVLSVMHSIKPLLACARRQIHRHATYLMLSCISLSLCLLCPRKKGTFYRAGFTRSFPRAISKGAVGTKRLGPGTVTCEHVSIWRCAYVSDLHHAFVRQHTTGCNNRQRHKSR